jgi:hypothetical protein
MPDDASDVIRGKRHSAEKMAKQFGEDVSRSSPTNPPPLICLRHGPVLLHTAMGRPWYTMVSFRFLQV